MSLEISLWLNCLDLLINQNWVKTLINAPNQSLTAWSLKNILINYFKFVAVKVRWPCNAVYSNCRSRGSPTSSRRWDRSPAGRASPSEDITWTRGPPSQRASSGCPATSPGTKRRRVVYPLKGLFTLSDCEKETLTFWEFIYLWLYNLI